MEDRENLRGAQPAEGRSQLDGRSQPGGRDQPGGVWRERPANRQYDDILYLPHPVSAAHPPMPVAERAAQFSPFAALTGYEDAIEETERMTQERPELTEEEKAALDEKLRALLADAGGPPQAKITLFVPDERKEGGAYVTYTGTVRKVDAAERLIRLEDGRTVPMDEILEIEALT